MASRFGGMGPIGRIGRMGPMFPGLMNGRTGVFARSFRHPTYTLRRAWPAEIPLATFFFMMRRHTVFGAGRSSVLLGEG